MKITTFFHHILLAGSLAVLLSGCEREEVVAPAALPAEVTGFIQTHFPANPVLRSVRDNALFNKAYEIELEGNFNLEFNKHREITHIFGNTRLPDTVIPEKLRQYVTTNYPANYIIEWEQYIRNQEVILDNEVELKFNKDGDFVRGDD